MKIGRQMCLTKCIRLQKLALLGPAVCSYYIIAHFATDARTKARTYDLRITPFLLRENGAKTTHVWGPLYLSDCSAEQFQRP